MKSNLHLAGLCLLAVLCIGLASPARAGENSEFWTTTRVNHPINEDWSIALWSQGRLSDGMTEADQFLIMPSVHYRLIPHVKVGLGYTYWAKRSSDEVDLSQEISLAHKFGGLAFGNRFRLEQRFINDRDDMILRGRYRLHLAHPLGYRSLYAVASEEIFVNLNNKNEGSGPPSGYEQNRLFGGIGFRIGGHWRTEVGYQWRNFVRRGDADRRDDHILSVNIFYDTGGSAPPQPHPSESHQ